MIKIFKKFIIVFNILFANLCDTRGDINLLFKNKSQMFYNYPDVVTVEQMSKMLCIGKTMAYSLIKTEQIRCVRIGNRIRIPKIYIIEYLGNLT